MSYDVAVWDGERPADDEQALRTYEALWERYGDAAEPPSPRILDYIAALTARYPDLTEHSSDDVDASPWADGPLTLDVKGPFFYFALVYSKVDEALPFIAETARRHGLVCFDPQRQRLL
jgi:hypothetical protein